MAIPTITPEPRLSRRRLTALAAAATVAMGLSQAAAEPPQADVPPATNAGTDDSPGLFNWLGNLIGHGQPAAHSPPPAQETPSAPAKPGGEAVENHTSAASAPPAEKPLATPTPPPADPSTTVGLSLPLGKTPPVGAPPSSCITKARETVLFCVEPVEWPDAVRPLVWVNSHMYQGTYAVVRYDQGRASYIHALIPSSSYEAVVAWYSSRWGQPDQTWQRQVVRLNAPKADNPTAVWQRPAANGMPGSVLEVRRFDDTRGSFADDRHGVIMLYAPTATPIFPQLSSVELMTLRVVEDPDERPSGVPPATRLPVLSAPPRRVPTPAIPRPGPPPMPEEAFAKPAVPFVAPPAPPSEANPFNPRNQVAPKLDLGNVEAPVAAPSDGGEAAISTSVGGGEPPAAAAPAKPPKDVFGRLSQFFSATPAASEPSPVPVSPPPAPTPARVDRTPDIRPPVYGFFTRLIRTYTEDGSEIANAGDARPVQGQMLRDVPLGIDDNLVLGMVQPVAVDGEHVTCFDKQGVAGHFCLIAPTWPRGLATALDRSTELPAVGIAALRFDLDKASHIQLRFLGDGFDQVVAFFTELYGPPTERSVKRTAAVSENPIVAWRSIDSRNGGVSTLEIRRYDDLLPDALESRVGVVRAFRDNSASLFPPLTSDDIAVLP